MQLVEVSGFHIFMLLKLAFITANSVDLDEMPHLVASHPGLHCLLIISKFWDVRYKSVCLFDLILYLPVNNLSVMLGRVFLG